MENMKIIIPHDGVNEIPKGYKPLFTEDGRFIAIVPEGTTKNDLYWLKVKNAIPIIDWEQRKYDLVKAVLPTLISLESDCTYTDLVNEAIMYADDIEKKLKGDAYGMGSGR